jgi:hypothetical protein
MKRIAIIAALVLVLVFAIGTVSFAAPAVTDTPPWGKGERVPSLAEVINGTWEGELGDWSISASLESPNGSDVTGTCVVSVNGQQYQGSIKGSIKSEKDAELILTDEKGAIVCKPKIERSSQNWISWNDGEIIQEDSKFISPQVPWRGTPLQKKEVEEKKQKIEVDKRRVKIF